MWECPDLFPLGECHVLISCPQGIAPAGEDYRNLYQCGWLAGNFDGERFEHGAFHELDRGFEFYAPQTTRDSQGRRLLFGWLGLPEENEMSQPTIVHGWIHQMSCPRELFWQDEWLCQRPVAELAALKGELTRFEGTLGEFPGLAIDSAWLDLDLCGEGSLWFGAVAELVWQPGASPCGARIGRAECGRPAAAHGLAGGSPCYAIAPVWSASSMRVVTACRRATFPGQAATFIR